MSLIQNIYAIRMSNPGINGIGFRVATDMLSLIRNVNEIGEISKTWRHDVEFVVFDEENGLTDGVCFKAHKVILKARCPVFRSMFESQMIESTASSIPIHHCKPEVFRALLIYLYTDLLCVSQSLVLELVQLASQYGLRDLERLCEGFMYLNIDGENCLDLLQYSDYLGLYTLKKACIHSMLGSHFNLRKQFRSAISNEREQVVAQTDEESSLLQNSFIKDFCQNRSQIFRNDYDQSKQTL